MKPESDFELWWPGPQKGSKVVDSIRGVSAKRVWMSFAGAAVELQVSRVDGESTRGAIAEIARIIGDAAMQVGRPGPVIILVRLEKLDANARDWLRINAADQDWHRGDFIIIEEPYDCEHSVEEVARELLSPLPEARALKQLSEQTSRDRYMERLRNLVKGTAAADLVERLPSDLAPQEVETVLREWLVQFEEEAVEAAIQAAPAALNEGDGEVLE